MAKLTRTRAAVFTLVVAVFFGGAILLVRLAITAVSGGGAGEIPWRVSCGDCPQLFQNNPEHAEISSQALRDRELAVPKPDGIFRILVLGDSIAFGHAVSAREAFPKQLEDRVRIRGGAGEVINAGVSGYTAYNELHYYLERGRRFEPDLVVVAFCMNDVADPYLHWFYTREPVVSVPEEAVPNRRYHAEHVEPILRGLRGAEGAMSRRQYERLLGGGRFLTVGERTWPVYIVGEDTIGIQVLTDYQTPEWRWLRGIYDRLLDAVRADGAAPVIAILPLKYQLDDDYPFLPQEQFARYCSEREAACLDLLPAFRRRRAEGLFMDEIAGMRDIWHLTAAGHRLVAEELAVFLEERGLLPEIR